MTPFGRKVELGGQIRFTRRIPHREDLAGMIAWLAADLGLRPRRQMVENLRKRPEVTIHLRTTDERIEGDTALLRRPEGEEKVTGVDLLVPTHTLVCGETGTSYPWRPWPACAGHADRRHGGS